MATGVNPTFPMATPMVLSIQVTVFKFNGLGRRMHTRLMNISKKNLDLRLVFDIRLTNARLMLGHSCRQWSNNNTALV